MNDRIVQFKRDADSETGVVEGEQLQGEYQTLPPKPIVVLEYQDGSMEVVTGRHRLDLAKRNGRETIPAAILREVDGWTPEKARTLDALDNILDEKGDDRDFIAFFRDSGIDRDTAEAKGLISRRKGRNAYAVAMQGETELVDAVMNGDVAADRAAAIAREAPKGEAHAPTVQRAVLKACLERPMTADDAGIMARSLMAGLEKQGDAQLPQQGDLFGADDSALLMAEAEARYAAGKRREALQAVQRLNVALSKGDALSLKGEFAQQLGITDTTDKVQIKQAIAVLKERALKWENYFTDPVLYQEAHEAAVRQMAKATPLFEQADGSFVASPVNGKTPAPEEETLPEELLDISSKPMPDVTKGDTFIALSREGISFADSNKRLKSLKGGILINNATGIEARLSATGANKLVSNTAVAKSVSNGFTRQQHYELASAIDQLFATAILTETRPDQYGDVNVKSIKRFYAPVRIGPGFAAAKITVKESVSHGHRIYSVEEIQITALPPLVRRAVLGNNSAGNAVTIDSVTYLDGEVKQNPVRPQGKGKSVAADGTPVVAGERLVLGGAYPYGERTMPLGGASDSPAMQKVTRNSQFPSKPRCVEILRGLPLLLRFKEKR